MSLKLEKRVLDLEQGLEKLREELHELQEKQQGIHQPITIQPLPKGLKVLGYTSSPEDVTE